MTAATLRLEDITALNVEASSLCTARCPFCSRQQKVRPYGGHLISAEEFQRLGDDFLATLKWLNFGGNFGDLATNREMVEIANHLREVNPKIFLGGDTNGAVQEPDWWAKLGRSFTHGSMAFAIDGLADTHGLHRVGTDFDRVIENLRAFVGAGGVAHWKFLVFRHNQHQVEEARRLAAEIGCSRFFATPSREFSEQLQPPEDLDFARKKEVYRSYGQQAKARQEQAICKPLANGSLYLAADGTVHPCCFAHCMYVTEHNHRFDFVVTLIERYREQINFKTRPLREIVEGPYFAEILRLSANNSYCRMKCSPYRKQARKDLLLVDSSS